MCPLSQIHALSLTNGRHNGHAYIDAPRCLRWPAFNHHLRRPGHRRRHHGADGQWAHVARQASGVFAAWSTATEPVPGRLAAASDDLARLASTHRSAVARRGKSPVAAQLRGRRDAALAPRWEHARCSGYSIAHVHGVYQRARTGTKAVITWPEGISQDTWFQNMRPAPGCAIVLAHRSEGLWGAAQPTWRRPLPQPHPGPGHPSARQCSRSRAARQAPEPQTSDRAVTRRG